MDQLVSSLQYITPKLWYINEGDVHFESIRLVVFDELVSWCRFCVCLCTSLVINLGPVNGQRVRNVLSLFQVFIAR